MILKGLVILLVDARPLCLDKTICEVHCAQITLPNYSQMREKFESGVKMSERMAAMPKDFPSLKLLTGFEERKAVLALVRLPSYNF